ncbi:RNA-directed DNA polymerase, eukaryota [Tanacetum coccineum]
MEAKGRLSGMLLIRDTNVVNCFDAMSDDRFIDVKGGWKGISEDRLNSQINVKKMEDFNNFINIIRFVVISLDGQKFTRSSDDGLKFSKLDRFLVSEGFKNKWGNLSTVALDRKLSDHCPIVLKDMDVDFSPKSFRVFDIYLKEADIENVLLKGYNKYVKSRRPECRFRDKLKNVKSDVKE